MRSSTWLLAWVWWSVSSFAVAQQSPAPQPSAAAPAAAEPAPPSAAAQGSATPPPAQASPVVAPPAEGAAAVVVPAAPPAGCVPSCRSGYVCVSNQCVSACNPPCSIGDVCTAHGECVSRPSEPLPGVPPEADSGIHTHDGFFMRFTTGPGGGGVGLEIPDEADRSYGGGGWSGSFDIGGAVTRDLALFGRLRGVWIIEPEVRIGGDDVPGTEGLVVDMGLFGAGLNYYVMPLNLYFAGAIGFATVTTLRKERNKDDQRDSSRVGFGLDLDVGKEWWVGEQWGLGVALRLSVASVPANSDLPRKSMFGGGFLALLFSVTYQ